MTYVFILDCGKKGFEHKGAFMFMLNGAAMTVGNVK